MENIDMIANCKAYYQILMDQNELKLMIKQITFFEDEHIRQLRIAVEKFK